MKHQMDIEEDRCPRCGSRNTKSLGTDGTTTETRLCRDCEAKSPDSECWYDVCQVEWLEAVRWCNDDGTEHEIYHTKFLAQRAVMDLLASLKDTLKLIRTAQEKLCLYLRPDTSDDPLECLEELLCLFDGPEQREIEKKALATIAKAEGEESC